MDVIPFHREVFIGLLQACCSSGVGTEAELAEIFYHEYVICVCCRFTDTLARCIQVAYLLG